MRKIVVIYDDSLRPNREVSTITGDKSYGDTIFKRITLKNRIKSVIQEIRGVIRILDYTGPESGQEIRRELLKLEEEVTVLHLYSNYALSDTGEFKTLIEKAEFICEEYVAVCDGNNAMVYSLGVSSYLKNLEDIVNRQSEALEIENHAFMDLSRLSNFLTFITGGFDARFFNALAGDEYTVTKKSTKIEKIKSEYNFYHLLPENMKMWFVMPYDYREDGNGASYTMERFHMTDIAIRFVHGAVSTEEFKDIMEKLFYFIGLRGKKEVSREEAQSVAENLYRIKLEQRMEDLRKLPEYTQFNQMLAMGTKYQNLDQVVRKYLDLYESSERRQKGSNVLVVGHGDLCFSNILYSREANILKLIDPKGALREEDLYTDPYYDLAKLSHSICGCYDFFNSGLYQITLDRDMQISLTVDAANGPYVEIFRQYLEANGYDYRQVRLYEAGLFLSMLPYHMDQPGKVFGFIMNAIKILEEVEK